MRGAVHYPHGIEVVYSPCNVAWLVLWYGTVLAVRTKRADAIAYADSLMPKDAREHV